VEQSSLGPNVSLFNNLYFGVFQKQSATGNVGALTDASKYTGAHKERFDADGKGKGADGRVDRADNSGYVGNYKGAGTFEKGKK